MLRHNLANNSDQRNTTFLAIQQVTKGGVFVGSNKLKHNTTGMMEIRYEDEDANLQYIMFTKNRRGPVNQKLYFSLKATGAVQYNRSDSEQNSDSPFEQLAKEVNPFQ
jgi:predicted ATP-dependent serine protease